MPVKGVIDGWTFGLREAPEVSNIVSRNGEAPSPIGNPCSGIPAAAVVTILFFSATTQAFQFGGKVNVQPQPPVRSCTATEVVPQGGGGGENGECNDNNPCTDDECINGVCRWTNLNGTNCADDGNPCTNDFCAAGQCTHLANTGHECSDWNPCTRDICVNGACTIHAPISGRACADDGDKCTDGNRRAKGAHQRL
jgi:hypothetical protein